MSNGHLSMASFVQFRGQWPIPMIVKKDTSFAKRIYEFMIT